MLCLRFFTTWGGGTIYTVDELSATKHGGKISGEFAYVAILGYVMKLPMAKMRTTMMMHVGRDITYRCLKTWRGLTINAEDKDDDMGKPPYPDVVNLTDNEKEYIYNWLDHYLAKSEVVGYVKEFADQVDITKM